MILYVKNMVCDRCIMIVRQQIEHLGFQVSEIALGKVTIEPDPSQLQLDALASVFATLGFEIIDKEKDQVVEAVKTEIINLIHHTTFTDQTHTIMQLVSQNLHKDQAYLSRLFSDKEGVTVERFIIQQKIEKVKELLEYGEHNLNEIAYLLGYSSGAHLSSQFKSITGVSPSAYKVNLLGNRTSLDKLLE